MTHPNGLCVAWGLRVRSAIALPGAMTVPDDDAPADLDILLGDAELLDPGATDGPYRIGKDAFEFTMPGVGRYLCAYRAVPARIVVVPARDRCEADLAAMLIATVIPAFLWAAGQVVLHAAAAVLPGTHRAVAVLGASGAGKSTMLTQAVTVGATVVADDSVCVRMAPSEVAISGLPGGGFAPLSDDGGCRLFHPVPPDRQRAGAPLGTLLVLDDVASSRRLTGVAAVRALLLHRHRPRITRLLGTDDAALARIAILAEAIPIHAIPIRYASPIVMPGRAI